MKRFRGARACLALVAAASSVAGCGGVSGSKSVSPGSLFLPGLIQYDVPRPPAPGVATPKVTPTFPSTLPS